MLRRSPMEWLGWGLVALALVGVWIFVVWAIVADDVRQSRPTVPVELTNEPFGGR